MKKYVVELTSEERNELTAIVKADRMAAHKRRHAQILLKADQGHDGPGWHDAAIAEAFDCSCRSVERLRQRLVEEGLETALGHGNRGQGRPRQFDGAAEARLIALACSAPPDGYRRWTMRLLADRMVALNLVEECSKSTVHKMLKKTNFSLT